MACGIYEGIVIGILLSLIVFIVCRIIQKNKDNSKQNFAHYARLGGNYKAMVAPICLKQQSDDSIIFNNGFTSVWTGREFQQQFTITVDKDGNYSLVCSGEHCTTDDNKPKYSLANDAKLGTVLIKNDPDYGVMKFNGLWSGDGSIMWQGDSQLTWNYVSCDPIKDKK